MPSWKSIDIEVRLISKIEARPAIWNVLSAEYKDRIKKLAQLYSAFFFHPGDSEVTFAVFESSCHLVTPCLYATRRLAVKYLEKTQKASFPNLLTIPLNESSCA